MQRFIRRAGVALAGLATVVAGIALCGFAASEVMIRRAYPRAEEHVSAAADPAAVARGLRVATVNGCLDCHGTDLGGKLFHDEPMVVRAWAPNLTLAAAEQSDAELARAIRHGVAADGRTLWIMPSEAFAELTDGETADLLAYIRSRPRVGARQPHLQVGPVGRLGVLLRKFDSAPGMLRAEAERFRPDLGGAYAHGRDLARACVECHGKDLRGREMVGAPDLEAAAAYSEADFARLLRTGLAPGDRRLGLMSQIAPVRFSGLSDAEVADLHAYLRARADKGL